MLSIVTYGRVFARAVANAIAQGELDNVPVVSSWSSNFTRKFSTPQPDHQRQLGRCHLASTVYGFSKFDSPGNNSPVSKPARAALLDKNLYGDDAFFIASNSRVDVLGVADGVGGWRAYGVDPSLFSRKLMETCEALVKSSKFVPTDPVDLLAAGFEDMKENKAPLEGSSTACIVMLDRTNKTLHSANLGDSGFMVVRKGKIVHRSEEQQHFFNSPYQLSIPPLGRSRGVHTDLPKDASVFSCDIELGDIILTATDGLFDNMDDGLILEELSKIKDFQQESLNTMAKNIAKQAHELSNNPTYMSPFAKQAKKVGYDVSGGKPDDITVILSHVTDG